MHFHMLSIYLTQIMRFKHILPRTYLVYKSHLHSSSLLFHFVYTIHIHDGFRSMNPIFFIIRYVLTHLTISVSHHDGCQLVHTTMWSLINAIRHQDKCRLVHPTKWDIYSLPYTIMTDADWCIPPSGTLDNFGLPS